MNILPSLRNYVTNLLASREEAVVQSYALVPRVEHAVRAETYKQDGTWLSDWMRGGEDPDSGVVVNERNGIKISTVFKCVNWRANQFGMLPKHIKERVELLGRPASVYATKHPLYRIVHSNPNPTMSSKTYFGLVSADLHLWGNSYAYIERGLTTGRVQNIWRLMPDRVNAEQDDNGTIRYKISDGKGHFEYFPANEIFHIPGLGYDGVNGYSSIRINMKTLGWNVAAQKYGSQFLRTASRPSGIVSITAPMKDQAKKDMIENLRASGKEAGKLVLIEGAVEYKQMAMPQDEAQFIETMQYQEEDICGIMGVPQHKVQILRRSTNNNIEHQGIEAVTDCIMPLSIDVEQAFGLQLLSGHASSGYGGGTERDRFFMECNLKVLLRGDTAAQTAHVMAMFDRGIYSGNVCAEFLGIEPYEGGDERYINRAYGPASMAEEWSKPTAQAKQPDGKSTDKNVDTARVAFASMFRDAVGRIVARKIDSREQSAVTIFRPIMMTLAYMVDNTTDTSGYVATLGKRSLTWSDGDVDATAQGELARAVDFFVEGRQ